MSDRYITVNTADELSKENIIYNKLSRDVKERAIPMLQK